MKPPAVCGKPTAGIHVIPTRQMNVSLKSSTQHDDYVLAQPVATPKRKGWLRRFLNFYDRFATKHPYITGVATSFAVFLAGDLAAQGIMPNHVTGLSAEQLVVVAGLSAYYGLESPEIFRRIDNAFPLEAADKSVHISRQGIVRALAYRLGIAPWWTMRHMAFLGLIHGSNATPEQIATDSLVLWGTWLVPLSMEEYLVQNKIPLNLRFLATSVGNFIWQISASLMALFRC
jgi:hypothetical protein